LYLSYTDVCHLSPLASPNIYHFFFFNATASPQIYTLSLHDALPISEFGTLAANTTMSENDISKIMENLIQDSLIFHDFRNVIFRDRKSTRLNSSHVSISYAVFCLKKKRKKARIKRTIRYRTKDDG